MTPFRKLTSRMVHVPQTDVDTDQIIPARFLKTTSRDGLADAAFRDWRFHEDGTPKDGHPFAGLDMQSHRIILAGPNFGCGSSREHAPWALKSFGIHVVISTEIADIFSSNALKNGILPVVLSEADHAQLAERMGEDVTVDLEDQMIRSGNLSVPMKIEPFARACLLNGTDPMGVLMAARDEIVAFEEAQGR